MKKILILICLILSLVANSVYASNDEEFLSVIDNAGILSEAVERYICTQNKILSEDTGARIIVATGVNTGELTVSEYARELYKELGIEHIGRNNSVFIFISEEEKDYCLIVSEGISAALTDTYAQKCLVKYMEADFDKGNYSSAVVKTFNAFGSWYAEKYNTDIDFTEDMSEYNTIVKTERTRKRIRTVLIVLLVVFVTLGLMSAIIRYRRNKRMERLRQKRQERRRRYMQIK